MSNIFESEMHVWKEMGMLKKMSDKVRNMLLDNGYEDVVYLVNYSYDDALIGVSSDNRAIYDFDLMVEWLMKNEGFSETEAVEWIDYNTIRALSYMGSDAPIIMYHLIWLYSFEKRQVNG